MATSDPIQNISASENITNTIKLKAAATATKTLATPIIGNITSTITAAGKLRAQIKAGTISASDLTLYNGLQTQLLKLETQLNATGQIDPNEAAALQKSLLDAKLQTIKPTSNTLVISGFTNFVQYILRTQALNPYSRSRVCDDDFVDMLTNISYDLSGHIQDLKALSTLITDAVKAVQ